LITYKYQPIKEKSYHLFIRKYALYKYMATLAISIHSIERRLRGGTQALLVRDGSGAAYVAKFVGNPQGTRTLINEWVVSRLLKYLRVSTPEVQPLHVKRGVPGDHLLSFQIGNRTIPIPEGIHFGSRCPVDPKRKAIFDFLPRTLLAKVANLPDLLMAYVFDKWVNQVDSRQAIFVRERLAGQTLRFRAYLIDHGLSFGGSRWELSDLGPAGLFHDRTIYAQPEFAAISHLNVDKIQQLSKETLFSIEREIPEDWVQPKEREEIARLLEALAKRQVTLHDTIDRTLRQLQQAGIAIPKNAKSRYLLALLLLTSCVPASLVLQAIINVEPRGAANTSPDNAAKIDAKPGVGFWFTARSHAGELIGKRAIRIFTEPGKGCSTDVNGAADSENCRYVLRIYGLGEQSEDQPLQQYTFAFEDTDENGKTDNGRRE
jgi:hypothetical protein